MLVNADEVFLILRSPRTNATLKRSGQALLISEDNPTKEYAIVNGIPILIDFERSVIPDKLAFFNDLASQIVRVERKGLGRIVKRWLLSPERKSTERNVERIVNDVTRGNKDAARVLVVGGGSIGHGMERLYDSPLIQIYAFDIYASPHVQFIADAHDMPLPDGYFDLVVVQAVLEHVLEPSEVVAEIWRVLRADGLVYAETPFMQQVHEGALDFTQFTESGHRYLFRRFERIASGASGGPGTQFMWAVDYLARGIFRSVTAGKVAKLVVSWTQYLDNFIQPNFAVDGASGVFFYGRKSPTSITPVDIVQYYQGAQ